MNVRIVKTLIWLVLLGVVGIGLKACSTSSPSVEPTAVAVKPPTTTPEPPLPTAVPPTPTETALPASPTPVPPADTATPEVEIAEASSENCIGCHTSEETLKALAVDKTVKSEATSGEG